jgi:hypothetical protein
MSGQELIDQRVCFKRSAEHSNEGLKALLVRGEVQIFVTLQGHEGTLSDLHGYLDRAFAASNADELFFLCHLSDFSRHPQLREHSRATLVSWRPEHTEEHFRRKTALLPVALTAADDIEGAVLSACGEGDKVEEIDVDLDFDSERNEADLTT